MVVRKTHLAQRLMIYITTSIVVSLVFAVAIQYMALRPIFEDTRNRNVDAAIENLVGLVAHSLWVFNEQAANEAANAILRDQYISGILVNDHADLYIYRDGDLKDSIFLNPKIDEIMRTKDEHALTVTIPLIVESQNNNQDNFNIGTLQIRSDNELVSQPVHQLAKVTLASTTTLIFILQVFMYFLVRNTVAKPLEMFTSHVQKLVANLSPDSTEVINPYLQNRGDEIGRLYSSFNQQRQELIERDQNLMAYRVELEETVKARTKELEESNETLSMSLSQLKHAQKELIQNEKLVSLGTLVSGIAHEVNTPLGIAITAASHLKEELRTTSAALDDNKLTKSGFEAFLSSAFETESLLSNNLNRAAKLIKSFKMVAVDQSSEEERIINLSGYIDEIILSLRPKLKHTDIQIIKNIPSNIDIKVTPGPLAQICTNLVMNSIIHGFSNGQKSGAITISAQKEDENIALTYSDTGIGMDQETLKRIYDPFFTTRRADGGSGLGMNIVYNLVTSKLNGTIESKSDIGEGFSVKMIIRPSPQSPDNRNNTHE